MQEEVKKQGSRELDKAVEALEGKMELEIEYRAARNGDILIMGDFNQWSPEQMERKDDCLYSYKATVTVGYKYRYQFIVDGNIEIDQQADFNESKLGTLTNYKLAVDQMQLASLELLRGQSKRMLSLPSYQISSAKSSEETKSVDQSSSNEISQLADEDSLAIQPKLSLRKGGDFFSSRKIQG